MERAVLLGLSLPAFALLAACGSDPAAQLAQAKVHLAAQDYVAARAVAAEVLEDEPGNVDALRLLAQSQLFAGDLRRAGQTIDRLRRAGGDKALRVMEAELAFRQGQPEKALRMLGDMTSDGALVIRAAALVALGRKAEALRTYEWGLKYAPDPRLADDYARLLITEGDLAGANRVFAAMRAAAPDAYATRLLAADLAAATGKGGAAIALYRNLARDFPERPGPHLALATRLDEAGEVDKAYAAMARAEALAPDDPRVLDLKILLLSELGRWGEIRDALQAREAELVPGSALGLTYAEALLRLGQAQRARVLFGRAVLLMPENPYAAMMLGEAQLATGDAASAFATLRPFAERKDAQPRLLGLAAKAARGVGDPAASELEARMRSAMRAETKAGADAG